MNYQNPFIQPYGGSFGQFQQQMMPAPQQVVRVNGENGARAYTIGANSSALLLDESGTMVWLVTSDGAGYKTVAPYDISPHKAEEQKSWTDLESRVKKLEELMGGKHDADTGNPAAAAKRPAESD